jgi:hypothetical protein
MNDQNNQMINDMLTGLDDAQKNEFQKLAKETLAARVLERIVAVLSDEEIEELKSLPENDASAVEVYLQSKFTKEEMEQMAREELGHIKDRMTATMEAVADEAEMHADVEQMLANNPMAIEDEQEDDTVASI